MNRPETASDTVDLSGYYSGFNYHNNNPGNRRHVNSNRQIQLQRVQINRPETASDTVVFQATPAVSTITTTTQAIEDTLTLIAATTTKGANDQTRDSLRHC